MAEILSQEEIEALLSSLSTDKAAAGEGATAAAAAPPPTGAPPSPAAGRAAPVSYEPYDFRRPDKLSKDQLRTLQITHETFGRLFSSGLSGILRQVVDIDLISVDQVPYDEYMRSLSGSMMAIFSLEPLQGQALFEMDIELVFTMIDRMLGGRGLGAREKRDLTEIERSLAGQIVDRALAELKTAWSDIAEITPRRKAIETNAQLVQIVPPNDTAVQLLYEARMGDSRGAMSMCFPYVYLKPIAQQFSGQRWYQTAGRLSTLETSEALRRKVETTKIPCVVQLGRTRIPLEEMLHLEIGDIIRLDRRAREEIDILVGGHVKFKAKPGTSGRWLAVQVTDVMSHSA
jgi:flagellar motor switch protein FliM